MSYFDDEISQIARNGFDALIDNLGRPFRLVYPAKLVPCVNCTVNPVTGKSSNIWKTGGPFPFATGSICPDCGGSAFKAIEYSDTAILLVEDNPKSLNALAKSLNINLPEGAIQIIGYLKDLPKVQRADYIVDANYEGFTSSRYKKIGNEFFSNNIVQTRYFDCLFQRAG